MGKKTHQHLKLLMIQNLPYSHEKSCTLSLFPPYTLCLQIWFKFEQIKFIFSILTKNMIENGILNCHKN